MKEILFGRNPVFEALRAGRKFYQLYILETAGKGRLAEIAEAAGRRGIPVRFTSRQELDRMARGSNHQGVVAQVAPVEMRDLSELLAGLNSAEEPPFLLLLDEIQDPHNLGSLLRSADAAGVDGIVIPKRRSVGLTAAVAKTSAGAVEYVPVAQVTNLARAMDQLKDEGLWIVGADMDGEQSAYQADLTGPIAIVLGGEGKGLGRLTREKCDFLVHLPMCGKINSLNASVAGALLMYEVRRQRNERAEG